MVCNNISTSAGFTKVRIYIAVDCFYCALEVRVSSQENGNARRISGASSLHYQKAVPGFIDVEVRKKHVEFLAPYFLQCRRNAVSNANLKSLLFQDWRKCEPYTRLVINKQHANTRASLAIQGKCLDSIDSTNNVFRYVPLVTLL